MFHLLGCLTLLAAHTSAATAAVGSTTRTDRPRIRLAVIGSSSAFAKKAHFPSLRALSNEFDIVANYTRSRVCLKSGDLDGRTRPGISTPNSTEDADEVVCSDRQVTEAAWYSGMYLRALDRKIWDAVLIILPIPTMPRFVEDALARGVHVISEKPVLPTTDSAGMYPEMALRLQRAEVGSSGEVDVEQMRRLLAAPVCSEESVSPTSTAPSITKCLPPVPAQKKSNIPRYGGGGPLTAASTTVLPFSISTVEAPAPGGGNETTEQVKSSEHQVWAVSENWRFEYGYQWLKRLVQRPLPEVKQKHGPLQPQSIANTATWVDVKTLTYVPPEHFLTKSWRKDGNAFVDVGVHYAAALREVVAGLGKTAGLHLENAVVFYKAGEKKSSPGRVRSGGRAEAPESFVATFSVSYDLAAEDRTGTFTDENSERRLPLVWSHSFAAADKLQPREKSNGLSNMVVRVFYGTEGHSVAADRYHAQWSDTDTAMEDWFRNKSNSPPSPETSKAATSTTATATPNKAGELRFPTRFSVEEALRDFAQAVRGEGGGLVNMPGEALQDLRMVEDILQYR